MMENTEGLGVVAAMIMATSFDMLCQDEETLEKRNVGFPFGVMTINLVDLWCVFYLRQA
eukprot:UN01201